MEMPKGPGSTSDNHVIAFTHSHSRTHSVTTYNVYRLLGIDTLSFSLVSFLALSSLSLSRCTIAFLNS